MFLIFTLKRPDILPVGDLGVQKGLLRWILSGLTSEKDKQEQAVIKPPPPVTAGQGHAPTASHVVDLAQSSKGLTSPVKTQGHFSDPDQTTLPPTDSIPFPPTEPVKEKQVEQNKIRNFMLSCSGQDGHEAIIKDTYSLEQDNMPSLSTLQTRFNGKKAKGNTYLLPEEMEALTEKWKPYRSIGE